jgi:hypothetical protein
VLVALREGRPNAPVRPWLSRIAHNEAVPLLRRRRPVQELPGVKMGCSGPSAHEIVEERSRLATLVADLRALPERQWGALVIRELSGLSREQIAVAFGVSAPDLWIETGVESGTNQLSVHLHNYRAPARLVTVAVAVGDQLVYGHPAPSPVLARGESRILDAELLLTAPNTPAPGFVSGYDTVRSKLYVVWTDGKRKVLPASKFTGGDLSYGSLLRVVIPDADLEAMTLVRFLTRAGDR